MVSESLTDSNSPMPVSNKSIHKAESVNQVNDCCAAVEGDIRKRMAVRDLKDIESLNFSEAGDAGTIMCNISLLDNDNNNSSKDSS